MTLEVYIMILSPPNYKFIFFFFILLSLWDIFLSENNKIDACA